MMDAKVLVQRSSFMKLVLCYTLRQCLCYIYYSLSLIMISRYMYGTQRLNYEIVFDGV
jgi:hypothetical protein